MRNIIIGDVHGMLPELSSLMDCVSPTEGDRFIFVGDLVDKGPDSPGVVRFVREMSKVHEVVLVEGNHEDKHRRFRKNLEVRPEVAGTMVERQPELATITEALTPEDVEANLAAIRSETGYLVPPTNQEEIQKVAQLLLS